MANVAALSSVPRATGPRRHAVSALIVSAFVLTVITTVSYLVGLYLPFRFFEAANGECAYRACGGAQTGAWWGFFANGATWEGSVPYLTNTAVTASFLMLISGPIVMLLLPVVTFAAIPRRHQAKRFEVILLALTALLLVAAFIVFVTPTGQRLWDVVLD